MNLTTSEIHVKIAEVKIGVPGNILKACLGSCVGIAFIWREREICGLAHCFLPESGDNLHEISARYVNQGIMSLMTLMKISKADVGKIEVYVAGGANMMNRLLKTNRSQIGQSNAAATAKWLKTYGFKVKKSDLGQDCGVKMIVDCQNNTVEFIRLAEPDYYIWKAS